MAIGTPGTEAPNLLPVEASGVSEVVASRNAAGMVTVDVNGGTEDDDYAGGATPGGSGDWNYVTMTKTDAVDEDTDTVVLYTDIAAPADVLFSKHYVEVTNFLVAAHVKKARSDNFPSGASASLIYSAESGNPLSFRGTFDDLPGVFTCSAPPCTLTTDDKSVMGGAPQSWNFTPDAPNTATVKVPDRVLCLLRLVVEQAARTTSSILTWSKSSRVVLPTPTIRLKSTTQSMARQFMRVRQLASM